MRELDPEQRAALDSVRAASRSLLKQISTVWEHTIVVNNKFEQADESLIHFLDELAAPSRVINECFPLLRELVASASVQHGAYCGSSALHVVAQVAEEIVDTHEHFAQFGILRYRRTPQRLDGLRVRLRDIVDGVDTHQLGIALDKELGDLMRAQRIGVDALADAVMQRLNAEPDPIDRAITLLRKSPKEFPSIRSVAREVGCDHSRLNRNPEFRRAWDAYSGSHTGRRPPRGEKRPDGSVEAFGDDA